MMHLEDNTMKRIIRYFNILGTFSKNCLIGYLEYRSNFYMEFISECVFVLMKLVYFYSIYRLQLFSDSQSSIFNPSYLLILSGSYLILTGIFVGFLLMNFVDLSTQIKDGTLDLLLVKPISAQFGISFRRFQFAAAIPNLAVGLVLFIKGIKGLNVIWYSIIIYILLMVCAMVLTYSIFLIFQLSAFWFVKTQALGFFFETVWDYNNMPMQIYPKAMIISLIYIVPLFVVSNYPALGLINQLKVLDVIWGVLISCIMFFLCRRFWSISVKKYSSASS